MHEQEKIGLDKHCGGDYIVRLHPHRAPLAQMVGADDIIYPQYILRHRDHFGDRQSVSRGLIQQFAATAAYSVAETAAPEVEMIAYIKRRRQSKARQGADRLHRQLRSIRFGRKGHAQPQSLRPAILHYLAPHAVDCLEAPATAYGKPSERGRERRVEHAVATPEDYASAHLAVAGKQIAHVTVVTLMSVVLSECDTVEYMWRTRKHHPVLARGHCIYHHGKLLFPQR